MAAAASLEGSAPFVQASTDKKQLSEPVSKPPKVDPPERRVQEISLSRFRDEDYRYDPPRRGFCYSSTYLSPGEYNERFQRKLNWIL